MKQNEILLEESLTARSSDGKSLTRFVPFILIALTLGFIAWFFVIFSVAYNFASPGAAKLSQQESPYYTAIFTRLPKDFHLFLFLLAFLGSAVGPGNLVLNLLRLDWRDELERASYALAVGLIVFTLAILGIGVVGLLQLKILAGLLLLAGLTTLWYGWKLYQRQRENWRLAYLREKWREAGGFSWRLAFKVLVGVVLVFYIYITLLGGLNLDTQWDSKWYHLGQAKHYAFREQIYDVVAEEGFSHAAFAFYQDMLYTGLYKIGGQIAAKLLHWGDAFLTVLFIIYFCRTHFKSSFMGLLAGLFFISTPVIAWSASTANTDLPLALYGILTLHAFLRWKDQRGPGYNWLVLIGLLGGYATGVKFFGVFTLLLVGLGVVVLSFLKMRERAEGWPVIVRQLGLNSLIIAVSAFLVALPWMLRTYFMIGNPIYPAGDGLLFHSPYWNKFAADSVTIAFQAPGVEPSLWGLLSLPWVAVAKNKGFQTIIGPLFLFMLPICIGVGLLSRERGSRLYRWLGVFVTLWSIIWFVSGLFDTRYTQAIMPFMTIMIAFAVVGFKWPFGWSGKLAQGCLGLILVVITALNSPLITQYQSQFPDPFGGAGQPDLGLSYLYGPETVYTYQLRWMPMIRFVNANLSATSDKIYDTTNLKRFSMYSDIQTYEGSYFDSAAKLGLWDIYSPDALQRFKQNKITFVTMPTIELPYLQLFPIWSYLDQVNVPEVTDVALFKINYPPELQK